MKKTNSTKFKNTSSSKDIKLPIIEQNKKKGLNKNTKNNSSSQNPRPTSTSQISKNSSPKNINKNNISANQQNIKGEKPKKDSRIINDIINNVNKSHNINTKITSSKKGEDQNKSSSPNNNSQKDKGAINTKINSPKANEKINKIIFHKKRNIQIYNDSNIDNDNNKKSIIINNVPRISKDDLKEIQKRRRMRIIREKKEFEKQTKMLNEERAINNKNKNKEENIQFSNKINSPIEMSQKKAQSILEEGGMIDAYKYLISHLCKNGMPSGNLYDYCSKIIKNYEKEWKKKKYKMINEIIQKHFEDKKKTFLNKSNMNRNEYLEFRALKKRDENQFIKKLDKSRSTLRIVRKNPNISILPKNENSSSKISSSFEKKNKLKKINGDNVMLNSNKNADDKKVYFNIKLNNNVGIVKNEKNDKNEGGKTNSSSFFNNNIKNNSNKVINLKSTKNNSNSNVVIKKTNSIVNINKNNNNSMKSIKKEENKNSVNNSSKSNSKIIKSNNNTKSNFKRNKTSKKIS